MPATIDLNVDLGETDAPEPHATELSLLKIVSSVNLSCGAHAGNPALLTSLLRLAAERDLSIGAHPSYPDRPNFGRRETGATPAEIETFVAQQLADLAALAQPVGARLRYVKPHGALYHRVSRDPLAAAALVKSVARHDRQFGLLGPAGSQLERAAAQHGLAFASEGFLDRGYLADGTLVPRGQPGDLITSPETAATRALAFARGELIHAADGKPLQLSARSLCTHGDAHSALPVLRLVHTRLFEHGVRVQPFAP